MPYAAVNGLDMYYEIHGDGPALLRLHAAPIRALCTVLEARGVQSSVAAWSFGDGPCRP